AHELTRAVRTVAQGRRYLSSPLSPEDVQSWLLQAERLTGDSYESLTGREREVLQLVAEGYSSTRIARRLSISVRTAEAHRANVMRKLRLKNYTALIKYALARGVLPPIEPLPRASARSSAAVRRRSSGRRRRASGGAGARGQERRARVVAAHALHTRPRRPERRPRADAYRRVERAQHHARHEPGEGQARRERLGHVLVVEEGPGGEQRFLQPLRGPRRLVVH